VPLISHHVLLSPRLLDCVTGRFGEPLVAALPPADLHQDPSAGFVQLHAGLEGADVVLFPDIGPGDLDGFFRLRLVQVLNGRPPLPGLAVVVLSADMAGPPLAGGFADRFRFGWPFARCVFLTEGGDEASLSAQLGLPVGSPGDPAIVQSESMTGQMIAVHIQPAWGRGGSTFLFENQVEDLVRAGFLTIRVFTDPQWRRGATARSRLARVIPENSTLAGAHINVLAVPDGAPVTSEATDADRTWRLILAATAASVIRDDDARTAAAKAECVIVNRLESVGPAMLVCPRARMLLSLNEDRAAAIHQFALHDGRGEAAAALFATAAARVQAQLLGIPDICAFVNTNEMVRLAPHCRKAVTVLPRVHAALVPAALVPDGVTPRFDLLLTGADDALNVASLRWFLDDVWRPHLESRGVSVMIAGRAGPYARDAAQDSPLVHVLGFVADLDAIRSRCRLTVVPDLSRSGISAKMLTALAAGHPVATTSAGLRGLNPAVAAVLPAHDTAAALAGDVLGLIESPDRLAERQRIVRQIRMAMQPATDHAALVMAVPRPSGPGLRKRQERWARAAEPPPPLELAPHRFLFGERYPMSGLPSDPRVLLDGWHLPEPWGRWTDGGVASLRIALPAPTNEAITLELDIVPSVSAANLRIGIDDTMLALIEPVPGANLWDIPPELTAGKAGFQVSLHVGDTVCPAAGGKSVDDRILGIGVAGVRLLSRQPTLCEPGTLMPVTSGAMPRQVLITGWHEPEDWGCWTSRTTASLRLAVSEPMQTPMRLELDLSVSPGNPPLTLSVNGSALPPIAPVDGVNRWDLPPKFTNERNELRLQLTVPETFSAFRAYLSGDKRELGIGLRGIRLVPYPPVFHEPGTRLRLVRSENLADILGGGWHPPEEWGCWTSGHTAGLRLGFREPLSGTYRLEMDLSVGPSPGHLTVSVNATALPAIIPVNGRNTWTLPEALVDDQRALLITLHVADTFCPADTGRSADNRTLGLGVRWLILEREAMATCRVGRTVRISSVTGDRGILVDGWHKPEPWGCWSSGSDASIRLRFAEPLTGPFVFEADMMPPLLSGPVILSVNGAVVAPSALVDGINAWVLPRNSTDGQTELEVHFLVALPVRPIDVSDSDDDRVLGLGLRSFRLRAED
jgi:hypothetical protein